MEFFFPLFFFEYLGLAFANCEVFSHLFDRTILLCKLYSKKLGVRFMLYSCWDQKRQKVKWTQMEETFK